MKASFASDPRPGQKVPLVFSATPLIDAPNTTLSISLPPQFRFVSGDLSWKGDLKKGETAKITAIVEPVKMGRGKIRANAVSKISKDFTLGKDVSLPVQVSNESVVLESEKFRKMGKLSKEKARNLTRSKATKIGGGEMKVSFSSDTSFQVAAASLVTISGKWYYNNSLDDLNYPIRYAKVKLFDDDSGVPRFLAETFTDENGYYQFPPVENDDGIGQGGLDVYVEVYAEGKINGKDVDSVGVSDPFDPGWPLDSIYWSTTIDYIVPNIGGDVDIGSWVVIDEDKKGAWYIHDRIIDGYKYMKNTLAFEHSRVDINWWDEIGDSFARSTPDFIYFISIAGDDEWDRDVITHEYSHTIQAKVYGLFDSLWPNPNCSPHYFETPSSLKCAYDEGWANFLGVAINNYYDPSDTTYDDYPTIWNIESWLQRGHPTYPALENDADKTEGEVIGIFWDIFDPANEARDGISLGIDPIWDVFTIYNPSDINEFWEKWFQNGKGYDSELWNIYYNHGINKDTNPPDTPTLISPSGTITDPTPTFSWNEPEDWPSGIAHYQIQVADNIDFSNPVIDTTRPRHLTPHPRPYLTPHTTGTSGQ